MKRAFVITLALFLVVAALCFPAPVPAQPKPIADPTIVPVVDEEVIEAAAGDNFHRQVIRAAIKAKRSGEISQKQLRRIRVAMISPAFREQAKELAEIQMFASGESDKIPRIGENIDWDALLAFIEKLIPLILKLIDAITSVVSVDSGFSYPQTNFMSGAPPSLSLAV